MPRSSEIESEFGAKLRSWRHFRRLSQLELSLRAEISQRHLSWLETGRSRPSPEMVMQLCETLDMPLRERNQLLNAAGFVAAYRQRGLEEGQMTSVKQALRKMLDQQMPYPSLVVDREWNLLMTNACADAIFTIVPGEDGWEALEDEPPIGGEGGQKTGKRNIVRLTLHPLGLKPLIVNWDETVRYFIQRLRRDLDETRAPEVRAHFEALIDLAGGSQARQSPSAPLLPMLTLDLLFGDQILRLFSVISTFGTAQDITTDELRIESFFPVDAVSDSILRELAGAA